VPQVSDKIYIQHVSDVEVTFILSQLKGHYEHSVALESLLKSIDADRPEGKRILDVLDTDEWYGPDVLDALLIALGLLERAK
jgi:hypothetical protein